MVLEKDIMYISTKVCPSTHSGHFTISNLSDEHDTVGDIGPEFGVKGVQIESSQQTDRKNDEEPRTPEALIDHSLEKLFACMSVAYRSVISVVLLRHYCCCLSDLLVTIDLLNCLGLSADLN